MNRTPDAQPRASARNVFRDQSASIARLMPAARAGEGAEASVSAAIRMMDKASGLFDSLQNQIAVLEETVYDLRQEATQAIHQKEDAFHRLVQAEQALRAGEERYGKVDAQLSAAKARVKHLEQLNEALDGQLKRMIEAVSASFATRFADEEHGGDHRTLTVA